MTAFSQIPPIEPGVSQELAKWRSSQYSNISYKLNLILEKMSPVLGGSMEIRVTQAAYACAEPNCPPMAIILDWRKIPGHETDSTISNVSINGTALSPRFSGQPPEGGTPSSFDERNDHLIFRDGVNMGENVIKLDFTSPILTSGSAITRYVDKEDGAEYIYSLFVPSDASTAFPVFDQPDLKARFELDIRLPSGWMAVSNTEPNGNLTQRQCYNLPPTRPLPALLDPKKQNDVTDSPTIQIRQPDDFNPCNINEAGFAETKPISTYVFAFAAGPFEEFTDAGGVGGNPSGSEGAQRGTPSNSLTLPTSRVSASTADLSTHIYVRKSQAAKFKPHAAEVFRLTREGVKYLETYFDYKFPFPKYDIVLVPEFPFGGMEHAGATFLKESSVIFPTEPTKSDQISRALLIFHETAHQWFGDTVTMKWFDDLWLKEGFAEFMAYKTLEKVMPEANAWKVFYERNKQAAYATDSTRGTTPIYQEIANLSNAKSAYGNIVYRKAPSFLRQAEFYLGADKFQTAVRAFLKKHEFANAGWEDLVKEFETASEQDLNEWAKGWVKNPGVPFATSTFCALKPKKLSPPLITSLNVQEVFAQQPFSLLRPNMDKPWGMKFNMLVAYSDGTRETLPFEFSTGTASGYDRYVNDRKPILFIFPNYQDYGYGIFLLDDKSRDYVLKNIQNEKDDFLRTMMWGSLWDSVREAELDPEDYVELAIKNLPRENDETIVSSLLGRVSTAINYYVSDEGGNPRGSKGALHGTSTTSRTLPTGRVSASTATLRTRLEDVLLDRLQHAATPGQRITFYRSFVTNASTERSRTVLKQMLAQAGQLAAQPTRAGSPRSDVAFTLRTKDKFDIVTRLIILGDPEAPKLLANLEKTEKSDDAKRYAYAARAGFATTENKAKYWKDFTANKDISESWIEAAFGPFNSVRHSDLTLPYLERALQELPNHKRNRKIFFVNGWLGAFIGGQRSEAALAIVNKFLADNPKLDNDLRLKILENVDLIERAVKIRARFPK